jgi:argininosuccinate synthase
MTKAKDKVVLAYSGGLDTSVLVRILSVDYGYDVIAVHVDVGEARDAQEVVGRAKAAGAVAVEMVEAQEEFARDFCFPALQANALYQGVYPLNSALSRPLIAKHLVAAARKHGAVAVAHGSTGKGNDQVRFDLGTKGLAPELKIVAPQRERNISRDAAMEYAAQHGIPVPASKKSPFSIDENLWGRSIEGGVLEDPATEPPEEAFAWTKGPATAPQQPTLLRIGFEAGLHQRRRPHRPHGKPHGGHQESRGVRGPGGGDAHRRAPGPGALHHHRPLAHREARAGRPLRQPRLPGLLVFPPARGD